MSENQNCPTTFDESLPCQDFIKICEMVYGILGKVNL
jgi:hypothetical protein